MLGQMHHKNTKLRRSAVAGLGLTWMVGTVFAQASLQTIEITGNLAKFGVPASRTAQAVSEIDREELDQLNVQSVQEALRYTPFVQAELTARSGFDEFLVRGFNQSRYQFKDGLRLDPGYLQQQEAWGLERIQVLRGPASVLFGQVAPGGIVNMVSKRPVDRPLREVGVSLGSFGQRSIYADLGGRADADGRWLWRLPVLASQRGDAQDFVEASRVFFAPSLTWRLAASTQATVYLVHQRDRYDRNIGLPVAGTLAPGAAGPVPTSRFLGEPALGQLEVPQWQAGWEMEHTIAPDWQLRQNLRWLRYTVDGPIVQAPRPGSTGTSITRRGFIYRGEPESLTVDTQLEGVLKSAGLTQRVMVGLDVQRYRDDNAGDLFGLAPIDLYNPVYGAVPQPLGPFFASKVERDQLGLYGQYRAELGARWVGTAGFRHSRTTTASEDPTSAGSRSEQRDRKNTFSASVLYLGAMGFRPYASYAESFEPQVGNDPLVGGGQVPPSLGKQVEVGLKWAAPDGSTSLGLAAFDLRQTNIVNGDPANPGFSVLVGEQRHRGLELEAAWRPVQAVSLQLAYALLDAKITRSNNGDAGLVPVGVPRHAASAQARFRTAAFGLEGAEVFAGLRHTGSRRGDTVDPSVLPAFTVADLGASARVAGLQVGLTLKNVTDKRHFVGAFGRSVYAGESRALQVSARTSF